MSDTSNDWYGDEVVEEEEPQDTGPRWDDWANQAAMEDARQNDPDYVGREARKRSYFTRFNLDERLTQDATIISKSEAASIILKRLPSGRGAVGANEGPASYDYVSAGMEGAGDLSPQEANRRRRDMVRARANLARKLAEAIPEEMRTDKLLKEGDIRALLDELVPDSGDFEDAEIGGQEFTAEERMVASFMIDDMTREVTAKYQNLLSDSIDVENNPEALGEVVRQAENLAMEYKSGEINYLPEQITGDLYLDPISGEWRTSEDAATELDDFGATLNAGPEDRTPTTFLRAQEWRRMVQSDELGFDDARMLSENGLPVQDPRTGEITEWQTGTVGVTYENTRKPFDPRTGPGGNQMGPVTPEAQEQWANEQRDWYTLSEILRKPYEMSRAEAMKLHEKLKAAGLYAANGGEPQVPGDVTDPAFQRAWKALASSALQTGKSMTEILETRAEAARKNLEGALAISLTDPARLRADANSTARGLLGRHLTEDEHVELIKFIHDLERRNAMIDAGLEETATGKDIAGVEGLDEGIRADIEARAEEWMREANPEEAEAADMADQFDVFRGLLAGPGRGGAF